MRIRNSLLTPLHITFIREASIAEEGSTQSCFRCAGIKENMESVTSNGETLSSAQQEADGSDSCLSVTRRRINAGYSQGTPTCCCCRFMTVLVFLLVQLVSFAALLLVGFIFVYKRFVYGMVITSVAILISIYGVYGVYQHRANEVFVVGVLEILHGVYLVVNIGLLMISYFREDGEKAMIEILYDADKVDEKEDFAAAASAVYALALTAEITPGTLSLVTGILCFKFRKLYKREHLDTTPFLNGVEDENVP
ncbi:hypothetical protein RB195_005272 [Necator americanus]